MEIMPEIAQRRSVRRYLDREVAQEDVLRILEAGRLAPSGSNTQPWRFLVVRDPEKKAAIAQADHAQAWMLSAPVFLVCLGDIRCRAEEGAPLPELSETSPDSDLKLVIRDCAIAISYMLLEAQRLGLATCWTGWFTQEEMRRALGVGGQYYVCGVIPLGYAAEDPTPRPRLPMEALLLEG